MRVCVYVLAAGESRRFGSEKLLQRLLGKELLLWAVESARAIGEPTVIVKPDLKLPFPVRVLINRDFKEGISTSVKLAIHDAKERNCETIAFFLGDIPLIPEDVSRAVLREAMKKSCKIIYPTFKGKKGFPTVVKREVYDLAEKVLNGDRGISILIKKFPQISCAIEVNSEFCAFDVDSPEDLSALEKLLKNWGM